LLRASPAPDSVLRSAPSLVHLWFSEDLNGSASRIVVWDRYRHAMNEGNATLVPGQPRQMVVHLKPLPPGSYLVLWTSVSAEDGHILHSYYSFSVKKRGPLPSAAGFSSGAGQTFPDAPTLATMLAHWIELLGAVAWVGAAAFSAFVFPFAAKRLDEGWVNAERTLARRWMTAAILVLIAASTVVLLLQAYGLAGNDWGAVFTRSTLSAEFAGEYAQVWVGRQVLALLALASVLRLPRRPREASAENLGVGPPAILGFVYLYGFAASGHAASAHIGVVSGSHVLSASIFVDWLHFLASALWFGGQMYIALVLISALHIRRPGSHPVDLALRGGDTRTRIFLDTLDRFSPVAYLSVALFAVTGPFNAKIHIPSWYAFFNSVYGRALIVKIGLIGLMMLISSYHVFRLRPRIRAELDSRHGARTEPDAEVRATAAQAPAEVAEAAPVSRRQATGAGGSDPEPMQPGAQVLNEHPESALSAEEVGATTISPSPSPSAVNRLTRQLVGWLRLEPGLGVGVLLAVSVMFYYPVPVGFGPPGPSAYTVHASGLTATLSIKPDRAGPNQVTVNLKNSRGQPVRQATVIVLPTMLDMPMGTGRFPLSQTRPGTYTGTADLGMGGRWRLEILVFSPSGLAHMFVTAQVGS
jgi:copper transport protein